MEYLKKIDLIISKIQEAGKRDSAEKLISLKSIAFNSTELLMSITYEMLVLINKDNKLKNIIEKDVLELQEYCKTIGLFITPND